MSVSVEFYFDLQNTSISLTLFIIYTIIAYFYYYNKLTILFQIPSFYIPWYNEFIFIGRDFYVDNEYRLRSEEHTAELQSRFDILCRILLVKKNSRAANTAPP